MSNAQKLQAVGIRLNKTSGQTKTVCPQCSHNRKQQNRKDPCLSVNIDEGIFNCHNCGWQGGVDGGKAYVLPQYIYTEPEQTTEGLAYMINERKISKTTLTAWKISEYDQYIPAEQAAVPCICFPYYKNDVVVNIKYRSLNKGFKMVSDAELVMYGLQTLPQRNTPTKAKVIITEGEIDALSVFESGYKHVLSVPNGASKGNNNLQYLDNSAEYLEHISEFILCLDKDEAGIKLQQELSRRIGKDRCSIVDYPEGCKDINQVLVKYGVDKVKQCIDDAYPMPIEGVVRAKDCSADLLHMYANGIDKGDMAGIAGFDNLVTFKTSMLYVFTGIPTHGKSSIVNVLEILLAGNAGWKWAIYSPEHYPLEYLVYRYAELLLGKGFFRNSERRMSQYELELAVEFIHENFFFIRPEKEMLTMEEILDKTKSLALRHGVRGLTIDPWNTVNHNYKTGMSETQMIEKALNDLTIFKQTYDMAIFLVAHPTKIKKVTDMNHPLYDLHQVPTLYDIAGSKSFYDKADVGITVYRNFKTGLTTLYVQKVKFKHLGCVGMQNMKYFEVNSRFAPCDESGNELDRGFESKPYLEIKEQQSTLDWKQEEDFDDGFKGESLPF